MYLWLGSAAFRAYEQQEVVLEMLLVRSARALPSWWFA